jgi:hypothetical protein
VADRISARAGLNSIALAMSIAAGAFFFPSFVSGLALPGFVLALVGFKHSVSVRRAGSDVHAAEDASERALHFGVASASLSGLLLAVALMATVFATRDYP